MAQTLGLNRQPLAAWKLSDEEIEERNRLFWTIYILDKTIALRSGRTAVSNLSSTAVNFSSFTYNLIGHR